MKIKKIVSLITSYIFLLSITVNTCYAANASVAFDVFNATLADNIQTNSETYDEFGKIISEDDIIQGSEFRTDIGASRCILNEASIYDKYTSSDDYRAWAQGDPRWGGMYLGPNHIEKNNCANIGCLVTSLTKMVIQAGLKDSSSFNVATMINLLNDVNTFDSEGNLTSFYKVAQVIPGLYMGNNGNYLVNGTFSSSGNNNTIINWINQGYHIVLNVGGHWVVVDEALSLSTGKVYIMNSLRNGSNVGITLESTYPTFYSAFAYTGGVTASSDKIITSNLYSPTIITVGEKAFISGTISSQLDLTSISLKVVNADQIKNFSSCQISVAKEISGKYYTLESLGVDLSTLAPGVYKIIAEVSNTDHTDIIINNILTVLANTNTGKNGTYIFRSAVDNSYVIGTNSDNNVQLSSGSDKLDCKWYVEYLEDGYYTIKNCASGLYLDIYSGGTAAGSNVWQYEGNQSEAQQWQILPSGNSYYLIPRCSLGCAADVDYSVMADGTNITIYYTDLYMGANQRFVLDDLRGSIHQYEHSISFYANGGELPSSSVDWSYYKADGVNTGRDVGNLIVYTIPGMTVDTNPYGYEVQVNKSGQVTARRLLGDSNQLIVPEGGMVISGHFNSGTDGGSFVSSINPNRYVGFDPASQAVYVYASEEEYAAHHKYVADGSSYGFLPTPSKEGYIFEGWYTSPTGGTKITESSIYSTDSLYAHWTTPVVTISGEYTYTGSPVIPNITVTVGDTILVNGTDYTVYYNNYTNAGTATYTIKALSGGNYSFPDITGTYVIQKAKASISDAPKAVMGLKYNGKEQTLITAGTALNGLMVYSFDGITYNENIPAATEPGKYTIFYKAQGSGNYTDSDIAQLTITIEKSNETIKSISVRSKYLYVIYGYSGSEEISRRENIAFDSATNDMIEWMYLNDSSCGLLSDFVNAFEAYSQSDSILLTDAQMKALEYILSSDYGNTPA